MGESRCPEKGEEEDGAESTSSSATAMFSVEEDQPCSTQFLHSFFNDAPDDADKPFRCGICLELVYKPIAQSCGHVFCFWCAHRSMNRNRESQCPACRRPFMFFPRVCKMLHFMLMKALPEEYEDRGNEIQNMEQQKQIFSPRFVDSDQRILWSPRKLEDGTNRVHQSQPPQANRSQNPLAMSDLGKPITRVLSHDKQSSGRMESESGVTLEQGQVVGDVDKFRQEDVESVLTKDDFICSLCSRLLYRPVVLNCGEVFCESCVASSAATASGSHCPTCGDPCLGGSGLVCLELHHFLERAFPADYKERSQDALYQQRQLLPCTLEEPSTCGTEIYLHVGVGCDGCGMFPIVGDRYRCRDCFEKIGFDLCGTCYRLGGNLSGRFNQQHKSTHQMVKIVQGDVVQPMILNMRNGTIHRRRQTQPPLLGDLDEYINSFIE